MLQANDSKAGMQSRRSFRLHQSVFFTKLLQSLRSCPFIFFTSRFCILGEAHILLSCRPLV